MTDAERKLRVIQGTGQAADPMALSDDDLMLLAQQGRKDAFEVVIVRHQALVLGCATRFLGDRQLGREVAQDVFLALWAERLRYRSQGRFKNLLIAMTFNRCRAVARARKNDSKKLQLATREAPAPAEETPLGELLEKSRIGIVREKLALLPDAMREALILRYAQGMSLAEIAAATEKPLGTIKSDLFRGVQKLRAALSGVDP